MTATSAMSSTVPMTSTGPMTPTVPVTSTGAMTPTVPVTSTGAMTSTVPVTSTGAMTSTVPVTATTTQTTTSGTPFVFGVILVGPYNDHGWSEANYDGGQYAEAKIPRRQDGLCRQRQPGFQTGRHGAPGSGQPDFAGRQDRLCDFRRFPGWGARSRQGPSRTSRSSKFRATRRGKMARITRRRQNESNFMGRAEYSKMIGGCAAALTTQTGKIGFLGPLINDETRRLADAAYLGAKYCWQTYRQEGPGKTCKFKVTWIGYWFNIPGQTLDPTKVADDFFNSGYDVVMSGIDTTEALVEAGKMRAGRQEGLGRPVRLQGRLRRGSERVPGRPVLQLGPGLRERHQAVQAGQWKYWEWNGPDWSDYNNVDTSDVGFTFGDALSADTKATLQT